MRIRASLLANADLRVKGLNCHMCYLLTRPEPIMLLKLPIMLLSNAPNFSLLCPNYAPLCPIMLHKLLLPESED